jgi:hypothetical protein
MAALLPAVMLLTPYAYPHDYVILSYSIVWCTAGLIRLRKPLSLVLLPCALGVVWFTPIPARYDEIRFVALAAPAILLALAIGLPAAADQTGTTVS